MKILKFEYSDDFLGGEGSEIRSLWDVVRRSLRLSLISHRSFSVKDRRRHCQLLTLHITGKDSARTMSNGPVPQEVVRKYNELTQESNQLAQKIAELEFDKNEHRLVEETLKPLDGKRRAYRLVGEVLVERTVEEVLPSVANNRENVSFFKHGYPPWQREKMNQDSRDSPHRFNSSLLSTCY